MWQASTCVQMQAQAWLLISQLDFVKAVQQTIGFRTQTKGIGGYPALWRRYSKLPSCLFDALPHAPATSSTNLHALALATVGARIACLLRHLRQLATAGLVPRRKWHTTDLGLGVSLRRRSVCIRVILARGTRADSSRSSHQSS